MPYRGRSNSRGRGQGRGRSQGRNTGPHRQQPTSETTDIGSVLNTLMRTVQSLFSGRDHSSHRGGYGGRGREPRPHPGAFQRHPRYDHTNNTGEDNRQGYPPRQEARRQETRRQDRPTTGSGHLPRSAYDTQPAYRPRDQSRAAQVTSGNPVFRELVAERHDAP